MRITYGLYRAAVRKPTLRLTDLGRSFPTPINIAASSIRRYHNEGPEEAWEALDQSLRTSDYWNEPGRRLGWSNAIRTCFQNYRDMASFDNSTAFWTGLARDVPYGENQLGVYVDVVLLDQHGYVGRVVLWDTTPLVRADALLMAAPVARALNDELGNVGEQRVRFVEIWHLRTTNQIRVPYVDALGAESHVEQILRRVTS